MEVFYREAHSGDATDPLDCQALERREHPDHPAPVRGEGVHYTGPMQWLGFLFYPVGISIGMILAWRRECLGGGITVACLVFSI